MNDKKLKALIKASNQLSNAWLEVYQASSTEMSGDFFEIRTQINNLEERMVHLIANMQQEPQQEAQEDGE